MKRITVIVLALTMTFTMLLSACSGKDNGNNGGPENGGASSEAP